MSDIAGQSAAAAAGVSSDVGNAAVGDNAAVGESATPGNSESDNSPPEGGLNPAWNDLLALIPSSLHDGVTPHLRKWDSNFQNKLSEVQSQYAPFEAFKDTPPETLEQALNFYQVMEQDPERVYNQMREFYGFGNDQGQQGQGNNDPETGEEVEEFSFDADSDITQHPKFQELLQNQELLAQHLVQQETAKQQQAFEQQIEQEEATIKQANPDFTEQDLTLMYQIAAGSNITLTQAAEQIKSYSTSLAERSARPKAPSVMGASGFVPAAENVDPRKLDGNGTRKLVADLLRQAKEQDS